jgi:type IV pilus assembly protein PilW
MIAILIGSLLLVGTVALFQQSRQNAAQDEQTARMQENGRYALRLIARELAHLGYFGGVLDTSVLDVSSGDFSGDCTDWVSTDTFSPTYLDDADGAAVEAEFDCIPEADVYAGIAESDVVAIQRVSDEPLLSIALDGTKTWYDATNKLTKDAIYLRTNQALGAVYQAGNTTDDGPGSVPQPATVRAYLPSIFYVGVQDGIPSLCAEMLQGNAMTGRCFVDGIENLQIEYGIDVDGDYAPDYYSGDPGDDVDEIQAAVTARVYVLVRSQNPLTGYTNDKTYHLGSTDIGPMPGDGYYRRVYSTTVRLPNSARLKLQRAGGT